MRITHSSDWHIGQELHGHSRAYEHECFFAWLGDHLAETATDVLLVTGDIYDTANPSVSAQAQLFRFLRRALDRQSGLQILIIAGNHDSGSRVELPGALLGDGRVHLIGSLPRRDGAAVIADVILPLRDSKGEWRATCALVPYLRPGDLPSAENGGLARLYADIQEEASRSSDGRPVIITGHLHIAGADVSENSERRIVVGGEEAVASALFAEHAAYVALGHLHRPQSIAGPTHIRYAGSPFPMSATERDYEHSVTMVELDDLGSATISVTPIPRSVPFLRIPAVGSANIDEVIASIGRLDDACPNHETRPYLEIEVALERPEPDLRARIDAAIGDRPVRLTRIIRSSAGSAGVIGDNADIVAELDDLKPQSVFASLYARRFQGDIPADLATAFEQLIADGQGEIDPVAEGVI